MCVFSSLASLTTVQDKTTHDLEQKNQIQRRKWARRVENIHNICMTKAGRSKKFTTSVHWSTGKLFRTIAQMNTSRVLFKNARTLAAYKKAWVI